MKTLGQALRRAVFISPLVVFCFLSIALASKNTPTSKHSDSQASARLITLRLTMSDNRVVLISQRDGEMITAGPQENKIGIMIHLLDDDSVVLDFFRVTTVLKKGSVVSGSALGIGSLELNSALRQAAAFEPISSVELVSVAWVAGESRVGMLMRCPCCVSCNGEQFCGITVETSCGNCSCM